MKTVITPARAQELLSCNIENNRRSSMARVRRYASDMTSGQWKYNGESIKIDSRGRLIDGQQRLRAIILSGRPQEMEVVEDIPEDVIHTLDQNRTRSAADNLHMQGYNAPKIVAGSVKIILNYLEGSSPTRAATNAAVQSFLSDFPRVAQVATACNGLKGIIPPSPVASVLFLGTVDGRFHDRAGEFLDGLITNVGFTDGDPRLALTRAIINQRNRATSSKMLDPGYVFHITTRAWNAWVEGRNLQTTRYHRTDASKRAATALIDVVGGPKAGTGLATLRSWTYTPEVVTPRRSAADRTRKTL